MNVIMETFLRIPMIDFLSTIAFVLIHQLYFSE